MQYVDRMGNRLDGHDLTAEWASQRGAALAWNLAQFNAMDPAPIRHLVGHFWRLHMQQEHDCPGDTGAEPPLGDCASSFLHAAKAPLCGLSGQMLCGGWTLPGLRVVGA